MYAFLDTKDDTIDVDLSNLSTRDVKKYERMFCSVEFWQEFAGYLCDVAVTKHKEEDLSLGTAKQYLSACKETVQSLYPTHHIWHGHDSVTPVPGVTPWYTKIRSALDVPLLLCGWR